MNDLPLRESLPKMAAIIPAYNESSTIEAVIRKVQEHVSTVVVVDDGSHDATASLAQHQGAMVLRHSVNLGKGAALKTGCDYAFQQGFDRIVVMDADGQHNPKEIPAFLSLLQNHDIVFGCRRIPDSMPLIFRVGNTAINTVLRLLYGLAIEDSQCGYRAWRMSVYPLLRWEALNYYVETEMIIKAGKKKLRAAQLPIQTIYSDTYKGTTVVDGVLIVAKMVTWRLFK